MASEPNSPDSATGNRGWIVTFAGLGINLALGVLYAWSIFKDKIGGKPEEGGFGWASERLNDPYAVCCLVFAFAMILAGRLQDKVGPRITATLGGILVGAGFWIASRSTDYWSWIIGFGVLSGLGIGFGYSSATPPALKWFPPAKTGMIAGIVVAGFGLAPVYLAPLTKYLVKTGVLHATGIYAILFTIIVVVLAQLLANPPATSSPAAPSTTGSPTADSMSLLYSPMFWLLWFTYFIGAGCGLMVISSINKMATKSMGDYAFVAVAVLAIGNAGGRILAGILSDKIGRRATLALVLLIQAVLMFAAIPLTSGAGGPAAAVVLIAALIGANYGANLSLFPSITKDMWGLKSFGMNYGLLFTAWGVGGFVLPKVQQKLYAGSNSFTSSFITAGSLLVLGALLTLGLKMQKKEG